MNKLLVQLGLEEMNSVEKAYKNPTAERLYNVPKINQTEDLVKYVCSCDGLALRYVSKKLITNELCKIAVTQNVLSLKYVPEKYITNELCKIAVTQNGLLLEFVPEKYRTYELCEEAVSNNGRALEYVPEIMKTLELSEKAISFYLDIPYQRFYETKEDYEKKCQQYIDNSKVQGCELNEYHKYPISFVPKKFLTEHILSKAIKYSPLSLKDVSNKRKTKKLVGLAVSINGLALKYVPVNCYSKALISTALENNPLSIQFVPIRYVTQELCNELFERDYRTFFYFPEEYVTLEMCLKLIELKKFSVFDLSNTVLLDLYGNEDIELVVFDDIPEKLRNNMQLLDAIMERDEYGALSVLSWNERIVEKREGKHSSLFSMPQNRRGFEIIPLEKETIEYLNTKAIYPDIQNNNIGLPIEITEQYVNKKDSLIVPLEPTPKNSLPVEYKNSSLVVHNLSNDENKDNIYYISDIHIEHQLFVEAKKIFQKKEKIEVSHQADYYAIVNNLLNEKVDELISDKRGILLIAGDVADSIELFEMFYEKLSCKWNGKIICILGNHELWDGTTSLDWLNPEYNAREIEEIVSDYKKTIDKYFNCVLLENELLIKYKNEQYRIISESAIMNATVEDLKEVIDKSTLTILGGIGYSGLNEYYNSDRGLYRKAITCLDEDKRRAKKFSDIYEKIKQSAYDKQIIVLSHTPVYDWTKEECNPNWIYVNGHTHKNTILKEKNGLAILSDNQVGYTPKKWNLNAFTPNCLWYDPFEAYCDGIYKITSDEYKAFNRGRGINSNGCNYKGTLYALKRNKMYMFLLDSVTSLCLMVGGSRKRLERRNIQYYYDNMLEYVQTVLEAIEPYQKVMLQLSEEVKKIGGTGTIHGCIVDISCFSHIYVNPFDGKITSYWALDILSRIVYDDIKILIEEKEPDLVKRLTVGIDKHTVPLIEKHLVTNDNCSELAIIPQWVLGTEVYEPSRIMKSVQYIWEQNVIRVWSENVLERKDTNVKMIE